MTPVLTRIALAALVVLLAGCADLTVNLTYTPQTTIEGLTTGIPITVFRFLDARGEEGVVGGPLLRRDRAPTPGDDVAHRLIGRVVVDPNDAPGHSISGDQSKTKTPLPVVWVSKSR